MNKLIFLVIVVFTCGILFFTCQDNVSPDKANTNTGLSKIPDIETCDVPEPEPACGRMTGGGSVFTDENVRVTRGFEIHCDLAKLPNNLEVNWQGGKKFHLTELVWTSCTDDPFIIQDPPAAPFDTFEGWGLGKLNKDDDAIIHFVFVDAGEPGENDTALIEVWAPGANPFEDTSILYVSGPMHNGNLQAHDDKDCE